MGIRLQPLIDSRAGMFGRRKQRLGTLSYILSVRPMPVAKPPTLPDGIGVRGGASGLNLRGLTAGSSASGELWREFCRTYRWGAQMKQRRVVFDERTAEAMARLQQQHDQFCRLMRAAIDRGDESCPTGVSTTPSTQRPYRELYATKE
jgi:hypothetical protein